MLKWIVAGVAVFCFGMAAIHAEEPILNPPEEPILNQPSAFYQKAKAVVDTLHPQAEEVYDIASGEWRHGVSASLYNFTSNEIHVASARIGYAWDQDFASDSNDTVYGGVGLDVPGIVKRLSPASVESWFQGGMQGTIASILGKYATVGLIGGYDLSNNEEVYGVTVGGRITW